MGIYHILFCIVTLKIIHSPFSVIECNTLVIIVSDPFGMSSRSLNISAEFIGIFWTGCGKSFIIERFTSPWELENTAANLIHHKIRYITV